MSGYVVKANSCPSPQSFRIARDGAWSDNWLVGDGFQVAYLIATLCTLPLTIKRPEPIQTVNLYDGEERLILLHALNHYANYGAYTRLTERAARKLHERVSSRD